MKDGRGLEQFQSATYIGEFQNDKRNGFGILVKIDGYTYKGDWVDNLKDG